MLTIMEETTPIFNAQQLLFCKWYTTRGDTFGNNTLSYAKAFDFELPLKEDKTIDTTTVEYLSCKSSGSRLYFHDNIRKHIQKILLDSFDDSHADARIKEIIEVGKDADAIQAVKIYNDLKQRITKKIDITSANRPLGALSDEELQRLAGE